MRDPNRIDKIIEELRKLWAAQPDLRLGQLLIYVTGDGLFYVEDDELLKNLRKKGETWKKIRR